MVESVSNPVENIYIKYILELNQAGETNHNNACNSNCTLHDIP